MQWIILIVAGIFEAGFALCLGKIRHSSGADTTYWFIGFALCLGASIYLLYKATLTLPIGTAYAVWTGIGATGIVLAGILFFKESLDFWRVFFLATLIISIIGLKLVTQPA